MIEKMRELPVNKNLEAAYHEKKFTLAAPLAMLVSRIVLFAVFQGCFCLAFLLAEIPQPWAESAKYWPYVVCFANIVCVFALDRLFCREGTRFLDFFRFHKGTVLKDLMTEPVDQKESEGVGQGGQEAAEQHVAQHVVSHLVPHDNTQFISIQLPDDCVPQHDSFG
jgi:hypothetical protein